MRFFSLIFFLLIQFGAKCTSAQEHFNLQDCIDSLARLHLQETNGVGFCVGINRNGIEEIFYYGGAQKDTLIFPVAKIRYPLGALSGTLTTTLFTEMFIRGDIGYDDPLQKYLPFNVTAPVYQKMVCKPLNESGRSLGLQSDHTVRFTPYACTPDENSLPQPILLCYLATHTSGLPAFPNNLKQSKVDGLLYDAYTQNNLYEFLKSYQLSAPISYDYLYSPLGLAILGHIMSIHHQTAFETLLLDRVLRPLEMYSTGFLIQEDTSVVVINEYAPFTKSIGHRFGDLFGPANGMYSTIGDVMKFLSANIGNRGTELKDVLDYTHNPRILLPISESEDLEIAMGWNIRKLGDGERRAVWQSSTGDGSAIFLGFDEREKYGVVILSAYGASVKDLGFSILKAMKGAE